MYKQLGNPRTPLNVAQRHGAHLFFQHLILVYFKRCWGFPEISSRDHNCGIVRICLLLNVMGVYGALERKSELRKIKGFPYEFPLNKHGKIRWKKAALSCMFSLEQTIFGGFGEGFDPLEYHRAKGGNFSVFMSD